MGSTPDVYGTPRGRWTPADWEALRARIRASDRRLRATATERAIDDHVRDHTIPALAEAARRTAEESEAFARWRRGDDDQLLRDALLAVGDQGLWPPVLQHTPEPLTVEQQWDYAAERAGYYEWFEGTAAGKLQAIRFRLAGVLLDVAAAITAQAVRMKEDRSGWTA
jgi:hypothetical protein